MCLNKNYSAIIFEFAFNLSTSHLILNLLYSYTEEIEKKFFISTQSFFFLLAVWWLLTFSSNRDSFVPEFESKRGKVERKKFPVTLVLLSFSHEKYSSRKIYIL